MGVTGPSFGASCHDTVIHMKLEFFPLKGYANIVQGNALTIDWESVISKEDCSYIMGNPPFLGANYQSKEQKADLLGCLQNKKKTIRLDYVAGWYIKASRYIQNTKIEVAFVSTNSIAQGEYVPLLWNEINICINFAYCSFAWTSEATERAKVHCVIIGFACFNREDKYLYTTTQPILATNINPYLSEGKNIIVEPRTKPIDNVSKMINGSKPNDGGYLSKYTEEEVLEIVSKYPAAEKLFKPLLGALEFINGKKRYCLWLDGISPSEFNKIPPIMEAIRNVKEVRENSISAKANQLAETPYLFESNSQPKNDYLLIPKVSSENRKYIPIGYMSKEVIALDKVQMIPNATLYEFGIITSNVHMSWMRILSCRLEERYNYTTSIVYNTFPWPTPTDKQRMDIEKTAQAILDARALDPKASLATLYNDLTMPKELRKAHQDNDRAVMRAYGMTIKGSTESDCVAELMRLYSEKVGK